MTQPHFKRERRQIEYFNLTALLLLFYHYIAFEMTKYDVNMYFQVGSSAGILMLVTIVINIIYIILGFI